MPDGDLLSSLVIALILFVALIGLDVLMGYAGQVSLGQGGFMGLGKSYYPVPFALLSFDPVRDVYVVTIDRQLLQGGPSWASNPPTFDQAYADRVSKYYDVASEDLSID